MVVPEREKGVKSFRVPKIFLNASLFFGVICIFVFLILGYDYWNLIKQVYKHDLLDRENQQLKEQIRLFQMKLNSLEDDIERINTFEKKLRVITGVEKADMTKEFSPYVNKNEQSNPTPPSRDPNSDQSYQPISDQKIRSQKEFINLKNLYEQKIASKHGQQIGYVYTKEWSDIISKIFSMADQYAMFDYKFNQIRDETQRLEIDIHEVDQYLLDKDSFLKSTPTLLPARGWITSYYGHRASPYSGRVKMHEGLDVGAKTGAPIVAPADGIVIFSGRKPGFGIKVQLDHGFGVETIFAHAQASTVKKGQIVSRGDIIAQIGNTGYSTGPHLHYEIRVNGIPVDPLYYILD